MFKYRKLSDSKIEEKKDCDGIWSTSEEDRRINSIFIELE